MCGTNSVVAVVETAPAVVKTAGTPVVLAGTKSKLVVRFTVNGSGEIGSHHSPIMDKIQSGNYAKMRWTKEDGAVWEDGLPGWLPQMEALHAAEIAVAEAVDAHGEAEKNVEAAKKSIEDVVAKTTKLALKAAAKFGKENARLLAQLEKGKITRTEYKRLMKEAFQPVADIGGILS